MSVRQKNDIVFPISLSEIAFMLIFMLMLLLGFMILNERKENDTSKARIAQLEREQLTAQEMSAAATAMTQAQRALTAKMVQGGAGSPEQVAQAVKEFANVGELKARQEQLQQEILDLTRKLVALEDLRNKVEQVGRKIDEKLMQHEVEEAIALRGELTKLVESPPSAPALSAGLAPASAPPSSTKPSDTAVDKPTPMPLKPLDPQRAIDKVRQAIAATRELRDQAKSKLGVDVIAGQESKVIRDVVEGARLATLNAGDKSNPLALKQENAKLRTQVAFYDKRDKLRGLDHPPCWIDQESKIEYIFNVHTTQAGFVVTRGWPVNREAQARESVGFNELMGNVSSPLTVGQFTTGAKPFLNFGKAQSPECRHFVYLSSTITDAEKRDDARRLVNSFFYILERKAPVLP